MSDFLCLEKNRLIDLIKDLIQASQPKTHDLIEKKIYAEPNSLTILKEAILDKSLLPNIRGIAARLLFSNQQIYGDGIFENAYLLLSIIKEECAFVRLGVLLAFGKMKRFDLLEKYYKDDPVAELRDEVKDFLLEKD